MVADRRSQQWFASLVQNASDVILVIEADTSIHFVSPACDRVLGYPPDELMGRLLADFLEPAESAAFHARLDVIVRGRDVSGEAIEFRIRHADGHWLDVETIPANLLADPNVKGIVLTIRDVSERKAFEAQLSHQAFYDSLTGLANRALFQNRVEHAMARRRPRGAEPSVLFMDLDDFKTVNDSLGHAAGDRLLTSVAARVQKCLRASDTAARLGGDEFAVLVEDSVVGSTELAARVLAALAAPFDVDGTQVHVSASIGIATADHGQHGSDAVASLLRNADVAMYSAKGEGGATWRAFEPVMLDAARRRLELKSALDRAVEREELLLNYQPIIELASDEVRGVEALVRWIHPQRGLIAPLDFIPLAEETGQIIAIGDWVLREACRTAVLLHRAQPAMPPVYMAVNLSGHQLQRPEIVAEVADALASSGLSPELLQLEITESVLMRDIDQTIERLQALKDLGVRLAIDDFGTGYSSLNHLRRFPVDVVKIDKSFVDDIEAGGDQRALVAMIIDLTLALGLRVVAEGIERPDQLLALRALGCDYGQGFLFARPVAFPDLLPLLGTALGAKPAA
jgi:diguanylate cyclase (GGDEF)-like protein/PAS domain S-box-containing protein